MSSSTRIDPSRISPAMLALMHPVDRARYASGGTLTSVPVSTLPSAVGDSSVNAHVEEQRIQGEILGWLKGNGYEPGYARMDRKSTLPLGWPDIFFAARNGRAVAFEVKTATGRTSPEQEERIARMQATGWTVQVVRSLESAKDFLRLVETRT